MPYKVIPFTANITRADNSGTAAKQVQTIIDAHATGGWKFQSLGSVETFVEGNKGCFGVGAQPGTTTSFQVLVFSKDE